MRDELLNESLFLSLTEACSAIETWAADYNNTRPHSSLDYGTPADFAAHFFASGHRTSHPDSSTLRPLAQLAPQGVSTAATTNLPWMKIQWQVRSRTGPLTFSKAPGRTLLPQRAEPKVVLNKLIIQIPCFNEAEALPITLRELPRAIAGFEVVEWLVIDDGSTDGTATVAQQHGVDHVLSLEHNQGLARAFMAGLEKALTLGADVIINVDADNQYSAACIPALLQPILEKHALIVVGARPIEEIQHFSPLKKVLQRLGSWVVRMVSGTQIEDAPSGFRAIHRDAAMRLNVFSEYTYTLETIIQAGRKSIPIVSIPIAVNPYLRPSRLISSIPAYINRSLLTILRIFVVYKPLRFFMIIAALAALPALFFIARFLVLYLSGNGEGHVQSLVLAVGLLAIAGVIAMGGMLAELIATNRLLLEDLRMRALRAEIKTATSTKQQGRE